MEQGPKLYRAIMVSSTFTDLEAHRREVIDAIHRFGFHANVMEYSGARSDADVIDTSLRMVRESVAYLCVIGHRYGQTPLDADRNPRGLSITELEFNEARRLGRPILLFLMADDHPVTRGEVEPEMTKRKKLEAFRNNAKRLDPGATAERVYETFASKDEFAKKAAIAVGLQAIQGVGGSDIPDRAIRDAIARFIDVRPDADQTELTDAIERFEAGYRALERQLAAIAAGDNRVTSRKADAKAALAEGDLAKARAALRDAADAAHVGATEPDASAIVQNQFAVTFEAKKDGQIGISPEPVSDRLLDDADSRDRHAEVLREVRAALHASRHGATQASDIAPPIADYIEALGAALLDVRPSLLILRGEKLRRLMAARAGPDSFAAPLSEDQANALEAWRIAHNLLVGLDPYLTRIERATYDPDTPVVSINIDAMKAIVEAIRLADIATREADSALKDSIENIPLGAPFEDRRAKSATENLANFARAVVKVVKFGLKTGAQGAKLGKEAWKLAKFVKSNITWFDHVFAGYKKVLDILHWVASLLP
jgi:hypothetical protein